MGFSIATTTLRISGENYTTVRWVTDCLVSLNYAYDVSAVAHIIDGGGLDKAEIVVFRAAVESAPEAGLAAAILSLESMIEEAARLQLAQLNSGSSFTISLTGIAESIRELADVFDPSRRADRKEDRARRKSQRQHEEKINKAHEKVIEAQSVAELQNIRDRAEISQLEALSRKLELSGEIYNRLVDQFGPEEAEKFLEKIKGEPGRAIGLLPATDVQAIEAPD